MSYHLQKESANRTIFRFLSNGMSNCGLLASFLRQRNGHRNATNAEEPHRHSMNFYKAHHSKTVVNTEIPDYSRTIHSGYSDPIILPDENPLSLQLR